MLRVAKRICSLLLKSGGIFDLVRKAMQFGQSSGASIKEAPDDFPFQNPAH